MTKVNKNASQSQRSNMHWIKCAKWNDNLQSELSSRPISFNHGGFSDRVICKITSSKTKRYLNVVRRVRVYNGEAMHRLAYSCIRIPHSNVKYCPHTPPPPLQINNNNTVHYICCRPKDNYSLEYRSALGFAANPISPNIQALCLLCRWLKEMLVLAWDSERCKRPIVWLKKRQ